MCDMAAAAVLAAADLYEAKSQAMSFMLALNAVNNEEAAGGTLQRPHIQQLLKKGPWGADSCKEGWPHLGICLARHAHHHVSKDWEVAYQLRCSLQQRACMHKSDKLGTLVCETWLYVQERYSAQQHTHRCPMVCEP